MLTTEEFFFRLLSDFDCKYGCKTFYGCLYYSRLCRVTFAIVHCLNMHNTAPHRTTAAEVLISTLATVQEGSPLNK